VLGFPAVQLSIFGVQGLEGLLFRLPLLLQLSILRDSQLCSFLGENPWVFLEVEALEYGKPHLIFGVDIGLSEKQRARKIYWFITICHFSYQIGHSISIPFLDKQKHTTSSRKSRTFSLRAWSLADRAASG
jgi:hypothetical protein